VTEWRQSPCLPGVSQIPNRAGLQRKNWFSGFFKAWGALRTRPTLLYFFNAPTDAIAIGQTGDEAALQRRHGAATVVTLCGCKNSMSGPPARQSRIKKRPETPKTAFLGYQIGTQANRYGRKQLLNK
jgi:hypothetical protein